jgi:Hemerythrin HHE cation binding domain
MSTTGEGHGNRLQEVAATEGRELEAVFGRIEAETTGPDERRRLVDQLLERLAAHVAARKEVLYPRVGRDVPDGDSLVDLALLGLAQIERTSREFAGLSGAEPSFHPLVTKLAQEVWEHLDEEEVEVLPALMDAIGTDEANEVGDALARACAARVG